MLTSEKFICYIQCHEGLTKHNKTLHYIQQSVFYVKDLIVNGAFIELKQERDG